jgi:GDSL-like lipase/acylhydrolase family protein
MHLRANLLVFLLLGMAVSVFAEEKANLARLVVVGDSLSAGFQNGSLLDSQQPHGYAKLIADQAGVDLPQPLIAAPGIPNVLTLVSIGPPPLIVPAPGASTGRDDPFLQAMDLAVPGQTVQDALSLRPAFPPSNLTDLILGLPGLLGGVSRSQVEWAEALAPTTIVLWIGNNDVLNGIFAGDPAFLTPTAAFDSAFGQVIDRLAATGATLAVANLPDATLVPFLTSAEDVAASAGVPLSAIGSVLGISPGDFVIPDALPLIEAILTGQSPGPLPGNVVLDSGEIAAIQARVREYNDFIEAKAKEKHAALVDIHALFDRVKEHGLVVGGQRLTTAFLGGVFSLDGIHPTNTGYAVIANRFIEALNREFDADIRPIAVVKVKNEDPLVLPGVGQPPSEARHRVSDDTSRSLRGIMGR